MKKLLSLGLAVLMLLSTVLGLAACGGEEDDGAIINTYYVGEMYEFDPARAIMDDDAMRVLALLYEPLFSITEGGKVVSALAESYEIKRNHEEGVYGMEITIRDTTWSDGNPVTAYDVVFAWKRILDPSFRTQAAPLLYEIENALEAKTAKDDENGHPITTEDIGAAAVNDKLISITFRRVEDENGKSVEPNYDAFLRNLASVALSPVRQTVVEGNRGKAAEYWGNRSVTIVTNGPFTVRTLDYAAQEFTIGRNRYYGYMDKAAIKGRPADEFVTPYQFVTDWGLSIGWTENGVWTEEALAEIVDRFANNSLFIMSDLPLELRKEYKKKAEVTDTLSTMSIFLNQNTIENKKSPFADPAIRRTLSGVLDREAIAELLVFAKPATGLIGDRVFNADSKRDGFREEGGALLSTKPIAKDPGFDAAFKKVSRKTITLAYNHNEADEAVAKYVEAKWEELGFKVTLMPLSYNEQILTAESKDEQDIEYRDSQLVDVYEDFVLDGGRSDLPKTVDAVLVDFQMLSTDAFAPLAVFSTEMNGNGVDLSAKDEENDDYSQSQKPYLPTCGYTNEAYDALIEAAYNERDLEKRAELLHDAEELLLEDAAVIPLTFGQCHYVADGKIRNIKTDYFGFPLFTKTKLKNYQKYLPVEEAEEGAE